MYSYSTLTLAKFHKCTLTLTLLKSKSKSKSSVRVRVISNYSYYYSFAYYFHINKLLKVRGDEAYMDQTNNTTTENIGNRRKGEIISSEKSL